MCWRPSPIALAGGRAALGAKAVEGVVGEEFRAKRLVPHGIGDYDVVRGDPASRGLEFGVKHGVAALDFYFHVVDDRVHVGDGVALGLQFLAVQLERHTADGVEFAGDELELDEQASRAAGVVVAILTGPRAHDMRHEEADLSGGEELARALAGTFGELTQQILVGAAEEIGLHVGEAEPIARVGKGLDDGGEFGRVDVALAIALGGEIDEIDDARQRGILPRYCPHRLGQMLADVPRLGYCAATRNVRDR